jgi:hypothetical protein
MNIRHVVFRALFALAVLAAPLAVEAQQRGRLIASVFDGPGKSADYGMQATSKARASPSTFATRRRPIGCKSSPNSSSART